MTKYQKDFSNATKHVAAASTRNGNQLDFAIFQCGKHEPNGETTTISSFCMQLKFKVASLAWLPIYDF